MVEFKIVDEKKEEPLEFWIEKDSEGAIDVCVRDNNGDDWFVLSINTDGTLTRHGSISRYIGLELDDKGRIIMDDGISW